jgi:5-methylcytosine-specific restriction enzyme subunit McrC
MTFLPGIYASRTIQEFYESLAIVLARKVLRRAQKGLYRSYVSETELLPHVRAGWINAPLCRLPLTLDCGAAIGRTRPISKKPHSGLDAFPLRVVRSVRTRSLPHVRQAYHALEEA